MLSIIKRHKFIFWFFGTLFVFGLRALYFYANGQSITSRHLDSHHGAVGFNLLFAIILVVILIFVLAFTQKKDIFKWFLMPVIPVAFAPIHLYIGSLFPFCCPCCCTPRHNHQWGIVIIASVITVFFITLIIRAQVRKHNRAVNI